MELSRRVHRAQEILRDEMIVEAFEALEAKVTARWKHGCSTQDEREEAWRAYRGMLAFKAHFEQIITEGKIKLPKTE